MTIHPEIPIVYRKEYNIVLMGLENTSDDGQRWRKVKDLLHIEQTFSPIRIPEKDLALVHDGSYLDSLKRNNNKIAEILKLRSVKYAMNHHLQRFVLDPLKYQTAGSVVAAILALKHGWGINIGGGFHHAHRKGGSDSCFYADVTLATHLLMRDYKVKKVMIIDLEAHQGSGLERDFKGNNNVCILDIYNGDLFPQATYSHCRGCKLDFPSGAKDEQYLPIVEQHLKICLKQFSPDIVFYIAGTSVYMGDHVGKMCISKAGIIQRDEMVFDKVRSRKIPIVMLMGGGTNATIFADSILNLRKKELIGAW